MWAALDCIVSSSFSLLLTNPHLYISVCITNKLERKGILLLWNYNNAYLFINCSLCNCICARPVVPVQQTFGIVSFLWIVEDGSSGWNCFPSNLVDLEGGSPLADQLNSSCAASDQRDRTVDGETLETIWCDQSLLGISLNISTPPLCSRSHAPNRQHPPPWQHLVLLVGRWTFDELHRPQRRKRKDPSLDQWLYLHRLFYWPPLCCCRPCQGGAEWF